MEKILFSWSGGKDSAMALHQIQQTGRYEIAAALTTVTEGYERISMHGVRNTLLKRQVEALGVPLETVWIPQNADNDVYEARMETFLRKYKNQGITKVAFGDIFLEDLRQYRENNLARTDMKGVFPIWKQDTSELIKTFLELGFQAITTCVDSKVLDETFVGRFIDAEFLNNLPPEIDPCGENGEFHSFVFEGPIFKRSIRFDIGEKVLREGFYFCDLIPV